MIHIWSVLCRRGSIDQVSNTLTLVEVIEAVAIRFLAGAAPPDPVGDKAVSTDMQLVSLWSKDASDKQRFRVLLKTPRDPQPTNHPEISVDFEKGTKARTFLAIGGITWRGPGQYAFLVQVPKGRDWKTVTEIPLEVQLTEEGGPPPNQTGHPLIKQASVRQVRVTKQSAKQRPRKPRKHHH
jgi:hypothetical protein